MTNRSNKPRPEITKLLTPTEVAKLFRVDVKTVARWADAGHLTSIRTLGGHRRYRETEVQALLRGEPAGPAATHAVGVEALTPQLRAMDPGIPAAATYAVVERETNGLARVVTTDVAAIALGVSLTACAKDYARARNAAYIPLVGN